MDTKKSATTLNTITRDVEKLDAVTGNIYESVMIMTKRANQISAELKQELSRKLEDFNGATDNLEEVFENREQIEISRYYEKLPKPSLLSIQEFIDGKIYYRKATDSSKNN
jgi:DNA-directed RNA polymerase subunit K/omega